MKKIINITVLILSIILLNSCTEPYALQTNTFEEVLVVEAVFTNEFKKHEVKLTKSFKFEEYVPPIIDNAAVKVVDSDGIEYAFEFIDDKYVSTNAFQAVNGKEYQLRINVDGKNYVSTFENLPASNEIESVVANTKFKNGENGVEITVNSYDPTSNSKYYRYEYEQTYKVIVPKWSANNLVINDDNEISLVLRQGETRTCYKTEYSNSNLLFNTSQFSEDRVQNLPVKYIYQSDYSIANRYSILVKQYILNLSSYTYYNTLNKISSSDSALSPNQPGFIAGNIRCLENPNEKVVGIFDVTNISTKRIFFNYEDLFPGETFPPYFDECPVREFNSLDFFPGSSDGFFSMKFYVNTNLLVYYGNAGAIYSLVKPVCGDCTSYASNLIPSFWE